MSNTLRFKPAISMQAGQFFMHYCGLLTFFQFFFQKLLSRTQSEYQTVWVQVRNDVMLVLTRVQTVAKVISRGLKIMVHVQFKQQMHIYIYIYIYIKGYKSKNSANFF